MTKRPRWSAWLAVLSVLSASAIAVGTLAPASAGSATGWRAFLNGPLHDSYAPNETAITVANAASLVQKWVFLGPKGSKPGEPPPDYYASPTVADGAVFIGSNTGWFYKLDETTGAVLAKIFIGYQPARKCFAMGVVDTATIAVDPKDHQATVYVGGPDGYLYALSASNLAIKWRSVIAFPSKKINDYFEWSSPTVTRGRIYIGVSSNCDMPLIRGAVFGYNQVTGKKFAAFYTVPKRHIGGSVWASVAVARNGDLFVGTGNGPVTAQEIGYSESFLKLSPSLRLLGSFKVPVRQHAVDGDWGASATIFGPYVGDCNKGNGIYYVFNRATMKLVWERQISAFVNNSILAECDASAVYNGKDLFIGADGTKIKGKVYRGSVMELTTKGKVVWQTGLPQGVTGSPTLDGAGILAVSTFDNGPGFNATYLLSAPTGRIVSRLIKGFAFAQSTFANGWLFTANNYGVRAWAP